MKISNAKILIGDSFVDGGVEFDTVIRDVGAGVAGGADAQGCYLLPGLVDIHSHAAVGADASDGDAEGMVRMSRWYAARGVTSWCPTTMTLGEPELTKAMRVIRNFRRPENGAKAAGVNLEGPFVGHARCGAQDPGLIHAPDAALFHRLNEACGGAVRLVTVAPEEPGAIECIREISRDCAVSLGHTAADYDTAMAAYAAGASHTTHLFNAMAALGHRAPGVIAAASDAGATVELICDGLHVHPAVVRLTCRLFGDKLVLISDSSRCSGMPDGDYELGGQAVAMKGGRVTLRGTDTLAGSSIHLLDGVRRAVSFGIPLAAAVIAATLTPARVIGMDGRIGSLAVGKCADFVLLDRELEVCAVFIDGEQITEDRRYALRQKRLII